MQLTVQPNYYVKTRNLRSKASKPNSYASNQIISHQPTFKGNDGFNYNSEYESNLAQQTGWFGKKKRAKAITDAQMRGFYEAQSDSREAERHTLEAMKGELDARNAEMSTLRGQIDSLMGKIEESKADKEEQARLKESLRSAQEDLANAKADFEKKSKQSDDTNENYKRQTERQEGKGWAKVAGNEPIKEKLNESFIRRLSAERAGVNVKFPNGILFYGPKSTGKTNFASAFAEQSGCNYVDINMLESDDDILTSLLKAANDSKKNYEASGKEKKRTIILLDECDAIASEGEKDLNPAFKDGSRLAKLKNFLQKCSEEFKCTVFMTTNHPLRFSSEVLADHRIPVKIFLGPPEAEDAAEIFKHYLTGETDQVIDYTALANEVMKPREKNQAFSVGHIKEICEKVTEKLKRATTQKSLIDAIKEIGPDVTPEEMAKFAEEIAKMTRKAV